MATTSRHAEVQHSVDAYGAPPQPEEIGGESCPPSPSFVGLRGSTDLGSPGRNMRGVEFLEPPSDFPVSLPPTAPAREMTRDTRNSREPRVDRKVQLAQSKRFAEVALEQYNGGKKIKFELLNVVPSNSVPEPRCLYTHINFTARSSKEGSQEQLFFAELYHCRRRRDSNLTTRYWRKKKKLNHKVQEGGLAGRTFHRWLLCYLL